MGTRFDAKYHVALGRLLLLAAVAASIGGGCRRRNKCEEFRDIMVDWNDRCEAGRDISPGDFECSPEDARIAECLIACYRLPCDALADSFNECSDACE